MARDGPGSSKWHDQPKSKNESRAVCITVALSRERRAQAPDESLQPALRGRRPECSGAEKVEHARRVVRRSPAAAQCYTARRTRPPHRRHVRRQLQRSRCPRPRTTCTAASQLYARDDVTDGHAPRLDNGKRRAPSQAPSLVESPPTIAAASETTGAARQRRVESPRGARWPRPFEIAQTHQRENRITRRLYNGAAHLRHARVTIPPSARGTRERAPVPSGAAACYAARSSAASSPTNTRAHHPDLRITTGQRAPTNTTRTPTSPTKMPLTRGHPPDDARWRAPNDAPDVPRMTPAGRSSHQPPWRCAFSGSELAGCVPFTTNVRISRVPTGQRIAPSV